MASIARRRKVVSRDQPMARKTAISRVRSTVDAIIVLKMLSVLIAMAITVIAMIRVWAAPVRFRKVPIISVMVTTCAPGTDWSRSDASLIIDGSFKRIEMAVSLPGWWNIFWAVASGTKNRLSSLVPLRAS